MLQLQHAFTAVAEGAEFLVQAWRRVMEVGGLLEGVGVATMASDSHTQDPSTATNKQIISIGPLMWPLVCGPI